MGYVAICCSPNNEGDGLQREFAGEPFAIVKEDDEQAAAFQIARHREEFGTECAITFRQLAL